MLRSLTLNRGLVDFSSNDYLGLSQHPIVRNALVDALKRNVPLGATGSRLLSGNLHVHEEIEAFLAERFRSESALLFSSGYLANMAVLSAFGTDSTEYFSDELNHASLIDGMKMSKAKRTVFRHNDLGQLRDHLSKSNSRRKAIITESVFSMDGDLAPLKEIFHLAEEFGAWVIVDEAHATGVFGKKGYGRLEEMEAPDRNVIAIHTCGKAIGSQGAFVLSSKQTRDYMINLARPFIFSTGISPLLGVQIRTAVELLPILEAERKHLCQLSNQFRGAIEDSFDVGKSESQIVPIILGSNEGVLRASLILREEGMDVRAIRSPTVKIGGERLRVSLKSSLSIEDVQHLVQALKGTDIL